MNAYRRADPGLRHLVPGDGVSALHEQSRRWADRFHAGDPDYQDDRIWFEAARHHDLRSSVTTRR
ncbi:hypothetical protein ACWEFJ_30295 [Actinosynnema sp. NPDC004786]